MNELNVMMQGMISDYSKYVDVNSDEIVNDFCDKIKEHKIVDLDLNTYSCFRFWKHVVHDSLKSFYKDFKKENSDKKTQSKSDLESFSIKGGKKDDFKRKLKITKMFITV